MRESQKINEISNVIGRQEKSHRVKRLSERKHIVRKRIRERVKKEEK